MAVTKQDFIKTYVKAIREGNAAVFAGAGLSRPSGLVDWKDFLRPLAVKIGLDINKEPDYLSVAQFYRNERGSQTTVSQEIMNAFQKNVVVNDNIKILARLPIKTYWTTNYDELLENGIRNANRNPDVKTETKQLPLVKPGRDAVVYKMHGDVNNPSDAVLTKSDYEVYEKKRPFFRTVLQGDFLSKKFLFIGFSFSDPNIDFVLGRIRSLLGDNCPEHFCLMRRVKENDCEDVDEYNYTKLKQDMQERNLRNYGIQTVFVDQYEEITDILSDIEKELKKNKVFISGSADYFNKSWPKEKAEGLAQKLAGALVHENYRITTGFGLGIGSSVISGALDVIYQEKFNHVDEFLHLRPFPQNIANEKKRKASWKKYREDLLEETGISVFMFGNKRGKEPGSYVVADGCIQEYEIAKEKGNLIIPIGSTGDAAKVIFDIVKSDMTDYPYLANYMGRLKNETDVDEIVKLVVDIIKNATD